ncbi:unnamed protein product [Darwinula stevensoni]|uniref:Gustatory receptor n=1 Tax=Darwinula stevensoni TaxID=69355 RepID=A0A7R9ADS3_9CRUS|nr:unnamed protein product [Darwinula stevensoni]CAG0900999.1 unnamed protein product [Darwinula stevensoni]
MALTVWEKFRPTAALLLVCGSFPFSGIFGSPRPSFRVCTFIFLYSIFVFSFSIYSSMGVFRMEHDSGSMRGPTKQGGMSNMQSVVHAILIANLHVLSLFYQLYFLVFGRSISNLFRRFEKTFGHCSSNLPRWIPFVSIVIIVLIFLLRLFLVNHMRPSLFLEYQFYYEAVMGFNSATITVLTLAFCLELARTLQEIRIDSDAALIQTIYADVWMLAAELGEALSYPILVSLLNNFLMIFTELYNILATLFNASCNQAIDVMELSESSLNLLQQLIRFFLLTFGPYHIEKKASDREQSALLEERGKNAKVFRKSEREETLIFMNDHPIRICLDGYFPLGRSILVAMLDAVVTYMVILLQFEGTQACTFAGTPSPPPHVP